MRNSVRFLVALAAVVMPAAAIAGVPDPTNDIVPNCGILLPGAGDTHSPVLGQAGVPFVVQVRDGLNQPVPGLNVYLDISGQTDTRFSDTPGPGLYIDCTRSRVYTVTNTTGTATFYIRGAGRNSLPMGGIGPGGFNKAKVVAGSTQIKLVTFATPDQN